MFGSGNAVSLGGLGGLLAFAVIFPASCAASIFDIRDYGASGYGLVLNTKAIQSAVDACSEAGGGTVYFPAGKYLSGTIMLKSGVTLELDTGAVLLGSTDLADYPLLQCGFPSFTDRYCARALIWGENLVDVAIVGRGTIDGQGSHFKRADHSDETRAEMFKHFEDPNRYRPKNQYVDRPYIIRLISCRNVDVEGITLRNSPMWMQQYLNCDSLTFRGMTVYNHGNENNDMIDIDCCRDVLISDCFGDSDDDALTLKSTAGVATENVTIINCVLSSHCNALKMGTESSGGFKNITISNCTIRPSADRKAEAGRDKGLAGIALEMVDGGTLDRVAITNVAIEGQTTPLFLRLGNRARPPMKNMEKPPVGVFRNVVISNIVATDSGSIGCSITGQPGHPIENVSIENIRIQSGGGISEGDYSEDVPRLPEKYPECVMFGTLPAHGFYCRHVEGLTLRNIDLDYSEKDERPAIVCDDVSNLVLDTVEARIEPDTAAQIFLKNTSDATVRGCRPTEGKAFLLIQGESERIAAMSNDLSRIETPFAFEAPASESALRSVGNLME